MYYTCVKKFNDYVLLSQCATAYSREKGHTLLYIRMYIHCIYYTYLRGQWLWLPFELLLSCFHCLLNPLSFASISVSLFHIFTLTLTTLTTLSHSPHSRRADPPPPPFHRPSRDPYQMVAIKEDSIKLGQELGQGEFGSVLKGIYTDNKGVKVSPFFVVRD